jgi:NAD+ diphosphatase
MRMWDEASALDRVERSERVDTARLLELWSDGVLIDVGPEPSVAVDQLDAVGDDWVIGSTQALADSQASLAPDLTLTRRPTTGLAWDSTTHILVGRLGTQAYFTRVSSEPPDATMPAQGAAANASENLAPRSATRTPEPRLDLRQAIPRLSTAEAEVAVAAVALAHWHRAEAYCPACGSATFPAAAGACRLCQRCHHELFPRTDPAIIVAVLDDDDRLLLARQRVWGPTRHSVLAGFVEAGESLEQAVRREVAEEVGVEVDTIRYIASQPWPFPRSLMLGFTAHAATSGLTPDGQEIASARWFSRAEAHAAVADGTLQLPGSASIAFRLISTWLGDERPMTPPPGAAPS